MAMLYLVNSSHWRRHQQKNMSEDKHNFNLDIYISMIGSIQSWTYQRCKHNQNQYIPVFINIT